jgi:hypothetical protein
VDIVSEETIEVITIRQRVTFARYTYFIAAGLLVPWAFLAMIVLFQSFAQGHEAPNWAVALESAIVTGSLAVIFKDHLPSANSPAPRRGL